MDRVVLKIAPNLVVAGKTLPLKQWCRFRYSEDPNNMVYTDEFTAIFTDASGNLTVYSDTHGNAQRALLKHFNKEG